MKGRLFQTVSACTALVCACLFGACNPQRVIPDSSFDLEVNTDTCVVIRITADEEGSLYDVLYTLRREGEIVFEGSEGEYGFYITSVNHTVASGNSYWGIYTTLGTYEETSYSDSSWGTYDYNGNELASASYGVSGLPLVQGTIYALVFTPGAVVE